MLCSERPSRLKGIETKLEQVCCVRCGFLGSERPSRLKGIETQEITPETEFLLKVQKDLPV